ncbi:MAG TPA: potassium-transporting ATPase subunit F [Micrococcales bacterium]|nr:potassium-transporting ATPase subunit F [Micrococcales bacterium]
MTVLGLIAAILAVAAIGYLVAALLKADTFS